MTLTINELFEFAQRLKDEVELAKYWAREAVKKELAEALQECFDLPDWESTSANVLSVVRDLT